ncbi:MATE family efflux transporter [Testudinibacter sp. TR-2022]|uniref:MATE family efflux transporter n=1 Tax=Testudinibacter sp. TR-2022 TaxID=2585029 RepID=UPI001117B8F8|nr:MATE family efflux transporter [Testudinibacter sp. TR-2022]TNH03692.1 MATE family efflux transporter [Pasteurellaceae bacterium Phil31]TNH08048.1 MATE family efflux transporter [Testudinibacter sp. TR-2022]TNH10260.1 MATE family efflux transporter [Testudinibacter sp. TR-2022]TNH12143.1 MATE family efflux transporter [Testudinibacter sp. TR-2022]TNH16092.1 MATE family efflux transporter [Testudinibacter sp. TR-2022]
MLKFTANGQHRIEMRQLIKIALPILIAQIAQSSMGMIDTIMAGRVSAADMAAISIGASIWFPLVLFGHGLLLALPPTIAYLNGSGQRKRIAHQVRQGIWIVLLISMPLFALIYNSYVIVDFMGMEPRLATISSQYLQAMAFGIVPYLLMINFRGLNDGLAKTKPAMVIGFIGLLLNIPLNYIFIYGKLGLPAFGAVGCGIATALVNWLMMLMILIYCYRAKNQKDLKLFPQLLEKPDWLTLRKLLNLGVPIALTLCAEVTLFTIVSLLIAPLGANVVASHQITLQTSSFVFMLPLSISMATTILVGQRLGEQNVEGAKQVSYSALGLGLIVATATAILTLLFRSQIAQIFVSDQEVIAMASFLLLFAAAYQIPDSIQVIAGGALRAYKDTKAILIISLLCYWVIGMPVGYISGLTDWLGTPLAAQGFWIGFVLCLTFASVFLLLRLRQIQRIPATALLAHLERIK